RGAAGAVNGGLRNRLTSIIGLAVARSAATSTARIRTPAARTLRVAGEAQPHPGAWMIPYTIRPIPAADSTRPRQSSGGVRGSREGGTRQATSSPTTPAMGTMNTKILPPQNRPTSPPPPSRPTAPPTPAPAPPPAAAPPHADGHRRGAAFGEHVGQQRQRGREHHRRAQAHHRPGRDQLAHRGGEGARPAGGAEHGQPCQQHPLAAEPVGQAA